MDDLTHLVIEFYDKISSWEHSVVRESGLPPSQMHAIEIIGHAGELRMKELAAKIGLTTGTITVMVDKLEKLGAVTRRPHKEDRRSILVLLTDKGQKLSEEHHRLHLKLTHDMTACLNSDETAQFRCLLQKINQHI